MKLISNSLSKLAFTVLCQLTLVGAAEAYEIHSTKKGVGQTSKASTGLSEALQKDRVEGLNCSWYYSWGIAGRNSTMDPSIEFVPMKWGGGDLPGAAGEAQMAADLVTADIPGFVPVTHFLAFNEPDHTEQSNMTVAEILEDWPSLETVCAPDGLALGSAGMTGFHQMQQDFMAQAIPQGRQVDFMTFHAYPGMGASANIMNTFQNYYNAYGKDIWITEFNIADWAGDKGYTHEQSYTVMAELLYRLESSPIVTRYAIFPWDATFTAGYASHIFEMDGENRTAVLTPLGKLYADYRTADVSGPYPGVTYYLHNKGNRERLFDDSGTPSTADIYTEGSAADFKLIDAGNGAYYIISYDGSNKRLACNGSTPYWSTTATGSAALWNLTDAVYGWKYITHAGTGQRLYTPGSAQLAMGSASATTDAYKWAFIRSHEDITSPWAELTSDDFESGLGNWVDGGNDVALSLGNAIDAQCLRLRDNSGNSSATWLASSLDLTGTSQLKINFSYITFGFSSGEDFWLQFSDNGGTSWTTIKAFANGADFNNGTRYNPEIIIDSGSYAFNSTAKVRFQCDASANADAVYIDNVVLSGDVAVPPSLTNAAPFFLTNTFSSADAGADEPYDQTLAGVAVDADNDPLTYSLISPPTWLSVSGAGALSGTPANGDVGANIFTVQVSDGNGGTHSATLNIEVLATLSGYDAWAASHSMTGVLALATNDYDSDGMNNLLEYGLAGNPVTDTITGTDPVLGAITQDGGTNWIRFIHLERTNANHGLTYTVEQTPDLSVTWSNCIDAVVSGTGPAADSDFITVTNLIPIDGKTQEFIRLRIDK